jgi:hypothetical protein
MEMSLHSRVLKNAFELPKNISRRKYHVVINSVKDRSSRRALRVKMSPQEHIGVKKNFHSRSR